jgi:hypothetical protein
MQRNRITFNIELTFSKILSVILLIVSTWASLSLDAPEILLLTIPTISAIIVHKTHADKQIKINNKEENIEEYDDFEPVDLFEKQ